MSLAILRYVAEAMHIAAGEADRKIDEFVRDVLREIDVSVEPWVSRLAEMRSEVKYAAHTKAR